MDTKDFEEMLDYYSAELRNILMDVHDPELFKSLTSLKKDMESECNDMQRERWENGGSLGDDDDWEEMGGIDPDLAPQHDFDHDPVGFR